VVKPVEEGLVTGEEDWEVGEGLVVQEVWLDSYNPRKNQS